MPYTIALLGNRVVYSEIIANLGLRHEVVVADLFLSLRGSMATDHAGQSALSGRKEMAVFNRAFGSLDED